MVVTRSMLKPKERQSKKRSYLKKKHTNSTFDVLSETESNDVVSSTSNQVENNCKYSLHRNKKKIQLKLKRLTVNDLKNTSLIYKPVGMKKNRSIQKNPTSISDLTVRSQMPLVKNCSVRLLRMNMEEYKKHPEKSQVVVSFFLFNLFCFLFNASVASSISQDTVDMFF